MKPVPTVGCESLMHFGGMFHKKSIKSFIAWWFFILLNYLEGTSIQGEYFSPKTLGFSFERHVPNATDAKKNWEKSESTL